LANRKPVYSAEALKMNLEVNPAGCNFPGIWRLVHGQSGNQGAGTRLDEAAVHAAEQIKYKPALSNGHPVDFPAVVHIVFQTAY